MSASEAQKKASKKYFDNNYKQVKLSMPNAEAELLEEYCKRVECTKAGFIREAIKEKMKRDINRIDINLKINDIDFIKRITEE